MEHITIIGAGLVGSLLAILLGQRGFKVSLFEKRSDPRKNLMDKGRSINLVLTSRGIKAIEQADLLNKVMSLTIPVKGRMLHSKDGTQSFQSYGIREHEVNYSISRSELNICLIEEAQRLDNVEIFFDHTVKKLDIDQKNILFSKDSAGTIQHTYQHVIGTDGCFSAVRQSLIQKTKASSTESPLEHGYKELLLQPNQNGDYSFDKNALHIWPRGDFMLMALPNLGGSFTLTLYLPHAQNNNIPSFENIQNEDSLNQLFLENFSNIKSLIPDLAQQYFNNPTGDLTTVRCDTWHYKDSVLVMGDAAHAIVPFHGQGMNCGFEDCSELIRLIEKHGNQWQIIFSEFFKVRKPNADAIAYMALENYIEMRASVRDPFFVLKRQAGLELERRFPETFIPRYSMVMFHQIPYQQAYELGQKQDKFLSKLCAGKKELAEINFEQIQRELLVFE